LNCPEDSEILKEHIHDIKVYIRDILRTHAIVPKEKVIEAYNGWEQFFGSKQEDAAQAGRWQLEDIFGSELDFKSLGKELFNDNGNEQE
jgi:hypothetical protein